MKTTVLLYSNILILASTGQIDIRRIAAKYDEILLSIVSRVEVLGFNFPNDAELQRARQAIEAATQVLLFTEREAQYAIGYRKTRPVMKFPDAAILATARAAGADLLTQNTKDFIDRDLGVRVLAVRDL